METRDERTETADTIAPDQIFGTRFAATRGKSLIADSH